jgi:hypothetical protein
MRERGEIKKENLHFCKFSFWPIWAPYHGVINQSIVGMNPEFFKAFWAFKYELTFSETNQIFVGLSANRNTPITISAFTSPTSRVWDCPGPNYAPRFYFWHTKPPTKTLFANE